MVLQSALVPRCQSPTRTPERSTRERYAFVILGFLDRFRFFNSPISARPPRSPFKMTWELTRRRFTRAINSKYLFDRVVCLTWPRPSFLGALAFLTRCRHFDHNRLALTLLPSCRPAVLLHPSTQFSVNTNLLKKTLDWNSRLTLYSPSICIASFTCHHLPHRDDPRRSPRRQVQCLLC